MKLKLLILIIFVTILYVTWPYLGQRQLSVFNIKFDLSFLNQLQYNMHIESKNMLLCFPTILSCQCLPGFLLEVAGGSKKNDHECPFLRIVELFQLLDPLMDLLA